MNNAFEMDKVATLSAQLLANLDEVVFFSRISGFVGELFEAYKVQVFEASVDGTTRLVAENGMAVDCGLVYNKGQGLSGYVVRTKRAYYSNSKRDPLLATTKRDDCVESELCVPIISHGTILGTIHVQSDCTDRKFDESDITLILELCQQLESPLNNMRLYLIAKNLNRELEKKIAEKESELMLRAPISGAQAVKSGKIDMIGHSRVFMRVLEVAKKIANEDFPILISGESGTGKKLLARKIHSLSDRCNRELNIVHCASISEEQLVLELFGTTERPGALQRANGGTVVLDSVEELPRSVQDKILRFLITGELFTTDSQVPMAINVRIISTSKTNLKELAEEINFNEDLLYRLNIMGIGMPSLRERKDDIKILSEYFINNANTGEGKVLTSKAIEKLANYNWSGNIHELKNLMERIAILVSEQFIDQDHLPELEMEEQIEEEKTEDFAEMTLHDLERLHICRTLDHLNGNKTRAAKCLGITVKTLYNKLHSYGLVHAKAE